VGRQDQVPSLLPTNEEKPTPNGVHRAWSNYPLCPMGAPPSWAVVATGDKAAGSDVIRAMARRAGATITEVEGSHVIMISQPQVVTDVILAAVAAVS
jgi:hypothetical protein